MKRLYLILYTCARVAFAMQAQTFQPLEWHLSLRADSLRRTWELRNGTTQQAEPAAETSIMFRGKMPLKPINRSPFQCGPYWVPDPPPLFEDTSYSESLGEAVGNSLVDAFADATLGSLLRAILPPHRAKHRRK